MPRGRPKKIEMNKAFVDAVTKEMEKSIEKKEKVTKQISDTIKNKTITEVESKDSFLTGSDLLDVLVGGGQRMGYPLGKIINIVGDKSSGKSFLLCELIAACHNKYQKKFKYVYDDCESGFGFDTEKLYGFQVMPTDKKERVRSKTVEEAYCNVRDFFEKLKDNEFGIYGLDSLDGLTSEEADELADNRYKSYKNEKDFKQGSYKLGKPKYLSQEFFPQLADLIQKKNGLLVVISQVRDNIDPMSFEKFSRAGGKAMDFYGHTVLWLAQLNKFRRKGIPVGIEIKARLTKSKTPRPYREVFLSLLFDYGIDNIGTNIDYLFDLRTDTGLLEKDASAIWQGKEITKENLEQFYIDNSLVLEKGLSKKAMYDKAIEENKDLFEQTFGKKLSRDELIEYVETNGLQKELTKRVVDKWEAIEASVQTLRPKKYS